MARPSARTLAPTFGAPTTGVIQEPAEGFTGKYLVLLGDDTVSKGLQAVKDATGLSEVCNAADFSSAGVDMAEANGAEVFVLNHLKVAVVSADPTQRNGLFAAAEDDGNASIIYVEAEQIMQAISSRAETFVSQLPAEYLRGYKDAVDHLYASLTGGATKVDTDGPSVTFVAFVDSLQFTWGLQATKTHQSKFSGRGIRVAVLDTGFDLAHPDFIGRTVTSQSFIDGEAVNDLMGHGTHCIGTVLGPRTPIGVRRYGCANQAEIYAGKVLGGPLGNGADSGILAGINWAIENKCQVISMSLGAKVRPGEPFSVVYETIAQRALQSNPGTLIVAAAGNSSRNPRTGTRQEPPNPVGRPANCPSILAVAAVDSLLGIAPFSDGGINPEGGGVDIAGPGVDVFSSWPDPAPVPGDPARHNTISGTSMATPHVAGIAALWLEAGGAGTSAQTLWRQLTGNALRLNLPSRDVGAGLVQAPG